MPWSDSTAFPSWNLSEAFGVTTRRARWARKAGRDGGKYTMAVTGVGPRAHGWFPIT